MFGSEDLFLRFDPKESVLDRFDPNRGCLRFDVVQNHRSENHSRNSGELFPYEQRQKRQPHWILNARSDDFAVEEVLELVKHDEESQTCNSEIRRHGDRYSRDDGVTD